MRATAKLCDVLQKAVTFSKFYALRFRLALALRFGLALALRFGLALALRLELALRLGLALALRLGLALALRLGLALTFFQAHRPFRSALLTYKPPSLPRMRCPQHSLAGNGGLGRDVYLSVALRLHDAPALNVSLPCNESINCCCFSIISCSSLFKLK